MLQNSALPKLRRGEWLALLFLLAASFVFGRFTSTVSHDPRTANSPIPVALPLSSAFPPPTPSPPTCAPTPEPTPPVAPPVPEVTLAPTPSPTAVEATSSPPASGPASTARPLAGNLQQVPTPELKKFYREMYHKFVKVEFSINEVLPFLSALRSKYIVDVQRNRENIIIDVGANVGLITGRLIDLFFDHTCFASGFDSRYDKCRFRDHILLSFEPAVANFAMLGNKSVVTNWPLFNWVGMRAAIGNLTGTQKFYGGEKEITEQSSLDNEAAFMGKEAFVETPTFSLDDLFEKGLNSNAKFVPKRDTNILGNEKTITQIKHRITENIFLLKSDTEGYDMNVVLGAQQLLKAKRIRFISFEYHDKWFTMNRTVTLLDISTMLYGYDYECYWISPVNLIPMFADWWEEDYALKVGRNVFCGLKNDEMMRDLLLVFNYVNSNTPVKEVDALMKYYLKEFLNLRREYEN